MLACTKVLLLKFAQKPLYYDLYFTLFSSEFPLVCDEYQYHKAGHSSLAGGLSQQVSFFLYFYFLSTIQGAAPTAKWSKALYANSLLSYLKIIVI